MAAFFKDLLSLITTYIKGFVVFVLIIVVALLMVYGFASYQTTNSEFCDSCHYMEPYVRHWQASSHASIDCVACHDYSGGDLILSSIKYATDVYNTRPHAKVRDESCLDSDCHDLNALDDNLTYKENIFFKHAGHLDKVLRSGKLHCTSCHNQMAEQDGKDISHMKVNDNTCFICHFKDAGAGEAITGCYSCHGTPKTEVEHAGFIFNHQPYLELNVDCKQCHVQIVEGDGNVAEAKCHSCHVERVRSDYTEAELHDIHVGNNAIDCQKCHDNIKHGNFSMVGALDIQCENCHLRQHNQPKQMYMGIGANIVHDMPSSMFRAQVSCTGCHTHITPEGDILAHQEKKEASRNSCVTCHGENYDLMFDNWKSGSQKVMKDYDSFLKKTKSDLRSIEGSKKARTNAQTALTKAEENYNYVKEGHLVHNIQYGLAIMNKSADELISAMQTVSKSYRPPSRGAGILPENSCQTFCHGTAFFPEEVKYDGTDLPHEFACIGNGN